MRHYIVIVIAAVVITAFIVVYLLFDPGVCDFFPRCVFLSLTGYKCPGCGSQRAIHALLSGNVIAAFHYNAMLVCSIPVILLYGYAELFRTKIPRLYIRLCHPTIIFVILAITIIWWIARNVFGW